MGQLGVELLPVQSKRPEVRSWGLRPSIPRMSLLPNLSLKGSMTIRMLDGP